MPALDNQPANRNLLLTNGFRFLIQRLPHVTFFTQKVDVPGISVASVNVPTPMGIMPKPGDRMIFEPFTISFRVDEDLRNYLEVFDWLVAFGRPAGTQPTRDFMDAATVLASMQDGNIKKFMSDATLMILDANKNPLVNIFFRDAYPTGLSPLPFDATSETSENFECEATFAYRAFEIERL